MDLNEHTAAAAAQHAGLSLRVGQKVIDNVTGETGLVLNGWAAHMLTGGTVAFSTIRQPGVVSGSELALVETYTVRLTNGATVQRQRNLLSVIPANVTTDLEEFS